MFEPSNQQYKKGMIQKKGNNTILHPEFNWFFAGTASLVIGIDQYDEKFDPSFLRFANYWDALCFAHSQTYRSIPYSDRNVKDGFAYEDWNWNRRVFEAGISQLVAEDTIIFKRRRTGSQGSYALQRGVIAEPTSSCYFEFYQE